VSSEELAEKLEQVAKELQDIRTNDPRGWTHEAQTRLFELETQLRREALWLRRP
jgi:hypothetical protein